MSNKPDGPLRLNDPVRAGLVVVCAAAGVACLLKGGDALRGEVLNRDIQIAAAWLLGGMNFFVGALFANAGVR
jgi:hypothetical protein